MKELLERFPAGADVLALTDRQIDSVLLEIVTARADGNGITLPKFLSLGELENIYSVNLSLPASSLQQINERLAAAYQRLLSASLIAPALGLGQPSGVVTVTAAGRAGLPAERRELLKWAGGTHVTLAIVFTDIVDSTALNIELGDAAMSKIHRDHFAQSANFLGQHDGFEVKTIGDGILSVFRSVNDAFAYALALHRDPGASEIQVRAGIHIGPVEVTEHDIEGAEVAIASRVVGAISGAEIWMSSRGKGGH
jgi:class 3 adenylate cyclase